MAGTPFTRLSAKPPSPSEAKKPVSFPVLVVTPYKERLVTVRKGIAGISMLLIAAKVIRVDVRESDVTSSVISESSNAVGQAILLASHVCDPAATTIALFRIRARAV